MDEGHRHFDHVKGHAQDDAQADNDLQLDVIIADPSVVEDIDDLEAVAGQLGAVVVLCQVRTSETLCNHDPLRLAAAFRDAFDGVMGDVAWTRAD